jgi:hypothetical protein
MRRSLLRAVLQGYLNRRHMTGIITDNADDSGYYLSHHGVIKTSSQTTKFRVVFDGSATSNIGVSLNDTLYTGRKLQEDLFDILLRFRLHQYELTGDFAKMHRLFLVRPEDRHYQKIVWCNQNGEIGTYQHRYVRFICSSIPGPTVPQTVSGR